MVVDGGVRGVDPPVSRLLEPHAYDVLVGLEVGPQPGADVPERHELPDLGGLERDVVVHRPEHHGCESHLVRGLVGRYGVAANYAHPRVHERLQEALQRPAPGEDVVRVEHDRDPRGHVVQIEVDGGVLALPLGLREEDDVPMLRHERADDTVRPVGAAARHYQDLLEPEPGELLLVDRAYAPLDVPLLVVCADAYRELDGFRCRIPVADRIAIGGHGVAHSLSSSTDRYIFTGSGVESRGTMPRGA